ncbi:hypothetical protein HNP87_001453 [Methanococcus maripaludis]|uniref:Uncharacterized protein n=1 Tax=Methanococcus maripaludis TaxID=39152 RepID=A0A7J9NJZ4_METMI|nr:hypothetical protein [Methanococcus maripaludis]MBA2840921.1 hypothetical protein [Methanococcus maripaludis]
MIPFFVLDRPASLEILLGFFLDHPKLNFGVMTHANVSKRFVDLFREYPYTIPVKYYDRTVSKKDLNNIKNNLTRISDSGAFQKNSVVHPYDQLFQKYVDLKVDYGIINDVLSDYKKTVKSAEEAINYYDELKFKQKFNLMGVAQGTTTEEYCKCYEELLDMGYEHIAIGGLLKRSGESNYYKINSETRMKNIVTSIKEKYGPEKLFTLGIYNPGRHEMLEELDIWGADYKGWLFHYDEFYFTSKELLKKSGRYNRTIARAYNNFMKCKSNFIENKSQENREIFSKSKKSLDESLNSIGTSLQEFRYREVRNTLEKKIASKMTCEGVEKPIFDVESTVLESL